MLMYIGGSVMRWLLLISVGLSMSAFGGEAAKNVSIYQLLSTPEKFSGQLVHVDGMLVAATQGRVGLYPSIEYAKMTSFSSRISIKGDENKEIISSVCPKNYASIVAVFNYSEMDNYKYFEKIRSISFYKNLTQEYPKSESCLRADI
jgi:hypothetical protein